MHSSHFKKVCTYLAYCSLPKIFQFNSGQVQSNGKGLYEECKKSDDDAEEKNLKDLSNDEIFVRFTQKEFHDALRGRTSTVSDEDTKRIEKFVLKNNQFDANKHLMMRRLRDCYLQCYGK